MSEFKGKGNRVRCIDCLHFTSDSRCSATRQKSKTSAKKRRTCQLYAFKGEYENRTTSEAMYIPYVDKKTRKLLRQLSALGIVPVGDKENALVIPSTTADPTFEEKEGESLWTPEQK